MREFIKSLFSGYDSKKNRVPNDYRLLTLEEIKCLEYGSHVSFIDRYGTVRTAKVNGNPKRWKRNPDRVHLPLKYGMYEYWTNEYTSADSISWTEGNLVKLLDELERKELFSRFNQGIKKELESKS